MLDDVTQFCVEEAVFERAANLDAISRAQNVQHPEITGGDPEDPSVVAARFARGL